MNAASIGATAWICSVFLFALSGCKGQDPIAAFQTINKPCEAALGVTEDVVTKLSRSWLRQTHFPGSYVHNVKSTDSQVTPYTATIDFRYHTLSLARDSEEEAKAINFPDQKGLRIDDRWVIHYAYVNSTWIVEKVQNSSRITSPVSGTSEAQPFSDSTVEYLVATRKIAIACRPPAAH